MKLNLTLALTVGLAGWALPAIAHGVTVEHRQISSVEINAQFETGEPMANAQVLVYAPDQPAEPWQQGTTDDQGKFSFTPDAAQPGSWEVMVRQAGHGVVTTIPVGNSSPENSTSDPGTEAADEPNSLISRSTGLSPVQQGITIGSVIWGFIGTALFFARGKR
ncbi:MULTISPECIES: carboxypeptidase-like regulatory domain-containing protein [unclassified Nodosilinea]|uniref:Carboxypeptidase-like regulatory domain-containing protein n=1 Tax=Leptolyngbya subtilissima DQ-A4 TaxID=2933933 RepID=A0ABV0K2P1_9CYAN|nr:MULTISPECIES: carboxypeptidase-like regulatory domain-containing protein [unclassified Nodosilinea]MBD2107294.1 carboxypeptidase regulatory-like domain-containing protein [Nodosilinea sp. FACHB-13]MBD2111519.1 carboxypeptidase regulatory-like domain-containing protein [Nodosilinea sp. FACHB-141]